MILERCSEEALFFVNCLFSSHDVLVPAGLALRQHFGDVLFVTPSLPWSHSSYYNDELGSPIMRSMTFFKSFADPSLLVDAKLSTHAIEVNFSANGRRRINLDPGYMTLSKVVLASRKNYSHRIYLGRGVYAELELFCQKNKFNPLPYTYGDYRDERVLTFFSEARTMLKKMLAQKETAGPR